jgi:hypothetical protein
MANNLKLEIFRISLKDKEGDNKELKSFKTLFETINPDKDESYKIFLQGFIDYFNNEFKLNADENKAITSSLDNVYKLRINQNIIDGELFGGPTGIDQKIFKQNNAKAKTGDVNADDVATLPFYFKLWTPFDHNTGVLMVQSYSNYTITILVKTHLANYIQTYNYNLIFTPHITKEIIERYKKRSSVYKVSYVKEKLNEDKRKLLNPIFTEFENLKIKIEVSGFKKSVSEFWDIFKQSNKTIGSNVEDFDIKEEDDYDVVAYYKDEDGHKSNTSIAKNFKIQPTVFLPNSIKAIGKQHYDFEKIKNHTESILKNIKDSIGY